MSNDGQILYDTGRLPLWLRLPVLVMGMLFFALAVVKGFPVCSVPGFLRLLTVSGLSLYLCNLWFVRKKICYNEDTRELVILLGTMAGVRRKRISLQGAQGVCVERKSIRANVFYDICITHHNWKKTWLAREYGDAAKVAEKIADALRLPVTH